MRGTTEGSGAPEPTEYQTVWHKKGQHSNTARKGRGERALVTPTIKGYRKSCPFSLVSSKNSLDPNYQNPIQIQQIPNSMLLSS